MKIKVEVMKYECDNCKELNLIETECAGCGGHVGHCCGISVNIAHELELLYHPDCMPKILKDKLCVDK